MANAETRDLRDLDDVELQRRLSEAQTELINLRFGLATRQTEDTTRVRVTRRQIARIKTLMTEREQEA